jgi:hypothetical protein
MSDRIAQMINIQLNALELFKKKNVDYGDAFATYGIIGVLIRIQDKIQRALSITTNNINLVEDESMTDTMIDLHNYAAMALMLMEEGNSEKYVEVNSNSTLDDDSHPIDLLEFEEYEKYDFNNEFSPYTSITPHFQMNNIEYNDRDDDTCQEV